MTLTASAPVTCCRHYAGFRPLSSRAGPPHPAALPLASSCGPGPGVGLWAPHLV